MSNQRNRRVAPCAMCRCAIGSTPEIAGNSAIMQPMRVGDIYALTVRWAAGFVTPQQIRINSQFFERPTAVADSFFVLFSREAEYLILDHRRSTV